jgi:hypothetical protein
MTPLLRSLAFATPASFTYLVLAPLACGCLDRKFKIGELAPLLRSLAFAAPACFTYLVLAPPSLRL